MNLCENENDSNTVRYSKLVVNALLFGLMMIFLAPFCLVFLICAIPQIVLAYVGAGMLVIMQIILQMFGME